MPIKENPDVAEVIENNANPRAWICNEHVPLSKQDIAWLKKLESEIWIKHKGSWPHYRPWSEEKRKLTHDEWEKIKNLIDTHRLPLIMHNSGFGFSVGIAIHGTDPCEYLIFIDSCHLPQF
jgi:hypothetical protein